MVRTFLRRKSILVGGGIGVFAGLIIFILCNAYFGDEFHTMQDKISPSEKVDLTGMRQIQASGGSLPRFPALKIRLNSTNVDKIIVVNAESDPMDYVRGIPITLLGYRDKLPEWKHYIRRLIFTGSFEIPSDLFTTEAEEAKKYGFDYQNIIIRSRFNTPDKNIDTFVTFLDNLPQNAWIHFHCHHGRGRTTLMLVMLDIIKNAPQVALKDIIKRQHFIGFVDLFNTTVWKKGSYTKEMLEDRKKFIEQFYIFVCQRKAGGIQRWSEWKQMQKKEI